MAFEAPLGPSSRGRRAAHMRVTRKPRARDIVAIPVANLTPLVLSDRLSRFRRYANSPRLNLCGDHRCGSCVGCAALRAGRGPSLRIVICVRGTGDAGAGASPFAVWIIASITRMTPQAARATIPERITASLTVPAAYAVCADGRSRAVAFLPWSCTSARMGAAERGCQGEL